MSDDLKRYQREDAGNTTQRYNFLRGGVEQAKGGLSGPGGVIKKILDFYRRGFEKMGGEGNVGAGASVGEVAPAGGLFGGSSLGGPGGGGENTEGGPNSRMLYEKLGRDGAGFIADAYREFMRAGNSGGMGKEFDEWLLEYAVQKGVL